MAGGLLALVLAAVGVGYYAMVVQPSLDKERAQAAAARDSQLPPIPMATVGHITRAAFIGDSYTAGAYATDPSQSWATAFAADMGWLEKNFARGGTAYVNTHGKEGCGLEFCPNYTGMIPEVVASKPDVVVVSGGRNDAHRDPEEVAAGVTAFYSELRRALPEAKIVAVSPLWHTPRAPEQITLMGEAVRAAVTSVGGYYLDIGQPLEGKPELVAKDKVHPNDEGYDVIAKLTTAEAEKIPELMALNDKS